MHTHLPMVRKLASTLARKLPPSIEYDDLVQEGFLGLLQAEKRYQPTQNDNFSAYARSRILGAMLDSVRRRHWIEANTVTLEEDNIPLIPVKPKVVRKYYYEITYHN